MVVEDGQGMAAPLLERDVSLEVHLPQVVRCRRFEPLPGTLWARRVRAEQIVTPEDVRDRAGSGEGRVPPIAEIALNLASAPCRMRFPYRTDCGFDHGIGPGR